MDNQILVNSQPASNWQNKLPKVVFVIIALVIIGEVIWGARVLLQPVNKSTPAKSAVEQQTFVPSIILSTEDKSYKTSDVIPLSIKFSSGNRLVDGTDVVLKFDPSILEASPAGFVKGNIYSDYPLIKIDNQKGLAQISGISSLPKSFSGTQLFGRLNFTAKNKGTGKIEVVFSPDKTTDSTIVEAKTAKNILANVVNITVNIAQ